MSNGELFTVDDELLRDMDKYDKISGGAISKHFSETIYPDNEKLKKELIGRIQIIIDLSEAKEEIKLLREACVVRISYLYCPECEEMLIDSGQHKKTCKFYRVEHDALSEDFVDEYTT